jgi:hypothetical protein
VAKRRTARGKNKIITDWLKDPKKLETWAVRKLYFSALTLEDILNDPGTGQGSAQAQMAAIKQLYDVITVMLEDILPNQEELDLVGKGKEVPKHEAGQQEDAGASTNRNRFGTRSRAIEGTKFVGGASVGVPDRGGSGDEQTDLLDPGREG